MWRKEPPTTAEVKAFKYWWVRDGGNPFIIRLDVKDEKVVQGPDAFEPEGTETEWAPCIPPGAISEYA